MRFRARTNVRIERRDAIFGVMRLEVAEGAIVDEADDPQGAWLAEQTPHLFDPADNICPECGFVAASAAGLATHRRSHEED